MTTDTTIYRVHPGRGFTEAAALIGPDYAGVIIRDGWAPYRQFEAAVHQTCLAQLARRCHALIEVSRSRGSRVGSSGAAASCALAPIGESVRNRYKKYEYKIVPSVTGSELFYGMSSIP